MASREGAKRPIDGEGDDEVDQMPAKRQRRGEAAQATQVAAGPPTLSSLPGGPHIFVGAFLDASDRASVASASRLMRAQAKHYDWQLLCLLSFGSSQVEYMSYQCPESVRFGTTRGDGSLRRNVSTMPYHGPAQHHWKNLYKQIVQFHRNMDAGESRFRQKPRLLATPGSRRFHGSREYHVSRDLSLLFWDDGRKLQVIDIDSLEEVLTLPDCTRPLDGRINPQSRLARKGDFVVPPDDTPRPPIEAIREGGRSVDEEAIRIRTQERAKPRENPPPQLLMFANTKELILVYVTPPASSRNRAFVEWAGRHDVATEPVIRVWDLRTAQYRATIYLSPPAARPAQPSPPARRPASAPAAAVAALPVAPVTQSAPANTADNQKASQEADQPMDEEPEEEDDSFAAAVGTGAFNGHYFSQDRQCEPPQEFFCWQDTLMLSCHIGLVIWNVTNADRIELSRKLEMSRFPTSLPSPDPPTAAPANPPPPPPPAVPAPPAAPGTLIPPWGAGAAFIWPPIGPQPPPWAQGPWVQGPFPPPPAKLYVTWYTNELIGFYLDTMPDLYVYNFREADDDNGEAERKMLRLQRHTEPIIGVCVIDHPFKTTQQDVWVDELYCFSMDRSGLVCVWDSSQNFACVREINTGLAQVAFSITAGPQHLLILSEDTHHPFIEDVNVHIYTISHERRQRDGRTTWELAITEMPGPAPRVDPQASLAYMFDSSYVHVSSREGNSHGCNYSIYRLSDWEKVAQLNDCLVHDAWVFWKWIQVLADGTMGVFDYRQICCG
ncbi:unnamed protein product [Vitrella brassicaformis CCMP3155]|uniref:Uncharacterized protein n=2 Tax=Vitrella brassicaformis TaxID=1169539 RepID=A0A0G4H176_VITBC|nr:unnamed protein product [Vitrella brassicaformis CCMP3155]|eukprot:CEM37172.1 unnamed protein product [Vitrella brassicaformis CCMP3155]